MTLLQTAAMLQVRPATVERLARSGRIARANLDGQWVYSIASIEKLLRKGWQTMRPKTCWRCGATRTIKRRFLAAASKPLPLAISVRQCLECGEMRVVAKE